MVLHYEWASTMEALSDEDIRKAVHGVFDQLGKKSKVLAVPPDFTRFNSKAGIITQHAYEYYGEALVDILPALGTHDPVSNPQRERMFGQIPGGLFRDHDWRNDVVTIGHVPAEMVLEASDGKLNEPWPAQLNKLMVEGGHDLVLSIGQVVPHEVLGMANYNKNLFVGIGGSEAINLSHFIGAVYGMERMMGVADNPLRRVLNYASEHFLVGKYPVLYILTVIGPSKEEGEERKLVTRGLFIGDDAECFFKAAALSIQVNFTLLDAPVDKVVAFLDEEEFHSTWLGNKAIYRTRMLIQDDGDLIVLAPGVKKFGEDERIDELIRKYGYRTTPELMALLGRHEELKENLSALAHLVHGSSEGRFRVTYATDPGHGGLTREEVEGVGYQFVDYQEAIKMYDPEKLENGFNTLENGERIYFVQAPALGLWAAKTRFQRDLEAKKDEKAADAAAQSDDSTAAAAAVAAGASSPARAEPPAAKRAKSMDAETGAATATAASAASAGGEGGDGGEKAAGGE